LQRAAQQLVAKKPGGRNELLDLSGAIDQLPEAVRYAGAWLGKLGNQKAILSFSSSDDGPDSVYHLHLPEKDTQAVRKTLEEIGIQFRSIEPKQGGHDIYVFDQGRTLADKIEDVAEKYDVRAYETTGRGEFVGADTREAAQGEYDKVINDYEAKPNHPHYRAPRFHSASSAFAEWVGFYDEDQARLDSAVSLVPNRQRGSILIWPGRLPRPPIDKAILRPVPGADSPSLIGFADINGWERSTMRVVLFCAIVLVSGCSALQENEDVQRTDPPAPKPSLFPQFQAPPERFNAGAPPTVCNPGIPY
jgi:hypothetical protein